MNIVGLIPAAGQGTRLAPLPLSKEIFPLGFRPYRQRDQVRPKVVCHHLIERMHMASITQIFVVIGQGKWDIPKFLGEGDDLGVEIAYRVVGESLGTPFTLDSVYSFVGDKIVALGFPDIVFNETHVYDKVLECLHASSADVVLGLFPADQPELVDVLEVDDSGLVTNIVIKPDFTQLTHTWGVAVWRPSFSKFMHDFLAAAKGSAKNYEALLANAQKSELYVGDVIFAAIEQGLRVESVVVSDVPYIDIGTPQNLMRAIHQFTPRT